MNGPEFIPGKTPLPQGDPDDIPERLKFRHEPPPKRSWAPFIIATLLMAAVTTAICFGSAAIDGEAPAEVTAPGNPDTGAR